MRPQSKENTSRLLVLPALDLREGACVQLVGGSYAHESIREADPLAVSRRWAEAGLTTQHVVDLDAATGRGDNGTVVEALLRQPGLSLQIGGGVRSKEAIARLCELGAARVVLGTRAVEDPAWLTRMAALYPDRLVVAADVRGRQVVTQGWAHASGLQLEEFLQRIASLPLAGLLVTAVHAEGLLSGTETELFQEVLQQVQVPVVASGGISTLEELRALQTLGVQAAVVGMALYTGRLDLPTLATEFGP